MDATLVEVERERNGNYTLYAEVPFNSPQAKHLTKEMLIKADAGSRTKWQTFKINRTIKDTNADVIKVYADHISMDTINDAMKPKVVITQQTAEGALRQWANNLVSGKAYDVQSDITHVGSTEWTIDEVENARQALGGVQGSILDVWGGEYEFDNNRITLHKEMGRTAPTVLEYGRNIVSLEYEELIDGVYTSIYPYATYTPKSEDNKQLPDVMVTLDELIIDSEYSGNYETRRIQIVDFSSEFDSNAENPEIPTQAKLRTLAKDYVKNNGYGIPKISQEIDFVDLSKTLDYQDIQVMEEIELNDRVPVYYPNIDAETNDVKVTTTNWDVLNNRYSKITLSTIGAMNTNSITSKLNTAIKDLKAEQKKLNNTVPYLLNGQGNRVWWTIPDDNMEHKIDDTWFKKNGKYTIIYKWNGSMWEEVLNDETFITEIEAEVESAISKAEDAQALAVSEAEQALANANKYADEQDALITRQVDTSVNTAISTAEEAKQKAESSYTDAVAEAQRLTETQSADFNKKFEENATAMSTLSQTAKDADAKAQSALTKAGANANLLDTHQNTLNTINNITIPNINSSISSVSSDAKAALSSASSAMTEAQKADGKIADYVTKNGLVSGTTVDTKINEATGEISQRITTIETDKLDRDTYTNFYENDYKQTAQGVTDAWTAVNKIVDENGNTKDTFAQAVYDQNATRRTADFKLITDDLVTETTYTDGINGVTESIRSVRGDINSLSARNYFIRKQEYVNKSYAWADGNVYNEGGSITSDLIEVKEGDAFSSNETISQVGFYDENRNFLGSLIGTDNVLKTTGSLYRNFTVPSGKNIHYMRISFRYNIMSGITLDELKVMVNKGNVALDWTPAPEESVTQQKFDIFESDLKRDVTGETGRLTRVEGVASTAKTTADTAKSTFDTFYQREWEETASHSKTAYEAITKKDDEGDNYIVRSATYKQGIKGVSESISSLESAITSGGENYWVNSAFRQGASGWGAADPIRMYINQLDVLNYGDAFIRINGSWNSWLDLYEFPQDEFVLSADVGTVVSGGKATLRFALRLYTDEENFTVVNHYVGFTNYTLRNGKPMIRIKTPPVQVPNKTVKIRIYLVAAEDSTVDATRFKLEKGKLATAWSPSFQDMLGAEDFKVFKTDYERDDKAIKTELGLIDSGKEGTVAYKTNQALETANGNSTLISTIDKNYVKQSNIDASILADKKIKDTRSTNQLPSWYFTNYPSQEVREFKQVSTMGVGSGNFGILTTNVPWTASTGGTVKQSFETNTETHVRQSNSAGTAWGSWSKQIDTSDTTYQKVTQTSSLYERVLGSTDETSVKNNISRLVHASEIIQQEISRSGDKNLIPYWEIGRIRWADGQDAEVTDGIRTGFIYRQPNTSTTTNTSNMYTFSNDGVKTSAYVFRYYANGSFYDYSMVSSFTLTDAVPYARLVIQGGSLNNKYQLEAGTEATYYVAPSSKNMTSTITQLADNINLKVSSDKLISEINVSTEGIRIAGKNIQLDGNIYMTQYFQVPNANIKDLAVDKITGTNAQFTTMITKGLTADVITSTMIKADAGLFDMLFSSTLATTRLAAQSAWIKSANISTLDASKITSGTIATARLDATQIVTTGLSANVVKSTHIETSTALVDKIFASEAYIKQLTGKAAFISSIQTVSLSASNITSGTLDASKASVINIDASKITANKTTFVQSGWNAINSEVAIDGSGIKTQNTNGDFSRIVSGELRSFNADSSSTAILGSGRSQYFDKAGSQFILGNTLHGTEWVNDGTLQVTHNRRFAIGRYADYAVNNGLFHPYIALEYPPDKTGDEPMGIVRFYKAVYLQKDIYAGNNDISGVGKISFYNGGHIESQSNTSNLLIGASNKIVAYASGANAFEIDSGYMYLRRNLSMEGNNITNQSDRRLKTNIVDTPVDSLSAISNWVFKSFDRVNNGSHDDIGLIAQDTSEIVVYDEENDIFNVNSSKQIMMNSHGIQQLNIKVDDEITQLKAQIASLQDELAQIKGA